MKWVRLIVGWILVLVVVMALVATALLKSQRVLRKAADGVEQLLGDELGTRVSIGKVEVGLAGILSLEDVAIFDRQDSLLLGAQRVEASVNVLQLLRGRVALSHVALISPRFNAYPVDTLGTMNYRFALDSLASGDGGGSSIEVDLRTLTLGDGAARYATLDRLFSATNLSLSARVDRLQSDSIRFRLRSLRAELQADTTSVNIRSLRATVGIGLNGAELRDLQLETDRSSLSVPLLIARGTSSAHSINLSHAYPTKMEGKLRIDAAELRTFIPNVPPLGLLAADLKAQGDSLNTQVSIRPASQSTSVTLSADVRIERYPRLKLKADVKKLKADKSFFKAFAIDVPADVAYVGRIQWENGAALSAQGSIQTSVGSLTHDFSLEGDHLYLTAQTTDADLSSISALQNLHFGKVAASVQVEGNIKEPNLLGNIQLRSLALPSYTFHDVAALFKLRSSLLSAQIESADPNAILSTVLTYNTQSSQLSLSNTHLALHSPLLPAEWGSGAALSLDSLNLRAFVGSKPLTIENLLCSRVSLLRDDTLHSIGPLSLERTSSHQLIEYRLHSDIADALYRGSVDVSEALPVASRVLAERLPSFAPYLPTSSRASGKFSVSLTLRDAHFLESALSLPGHIQGEAHLSGFADTSDRDIQLSLSCPLFSVGSRDYRDATLFVESRGDSLSLLAQLDPLFGDEQARIVLRTTALTDSVLFALRWQTEQSDATQGSLNLSLSTVPTMDHGSRFCIRVRPSAFTIHDTSWQISPSTIQFTPTGYAIDHFRISSGQRFIDIQTLPITSDSRQPALSAEVSQIDLSWVHALLNLRPISFAGNLSGTIQTAPQLSHSSLLCNLNVSDFVFNTAPLGNLSVLALLDTDSLRLSLSGKAQNQEGVDSLLIHGLVDIPADSLHIDFLCAQTNLQLLRKYLGKIMDRLDGACTGDLQLAGPTNHLLLTGTIALDSLNITPHALNTPLLFTHGDTIRLLPDRVLFDGTTVHDPDGGFAHVSGAVFHTYLRRFRYDLSFDADHLLAYDWNNQETTGFWGTVRATGSARLYGDEDAVTVDANLTTAPATTFAYDASSPETYGQQEFITFRSRKPNPQREAANPQSQAQQPAPDWTDIRLNLQFSATPDAELAIITDNKTGEQMRLRGTGNITANYYNKGRFTLYGLYTIQSGTYEITIQDLLRRPFQMQPGGTLTFNGSSSDGDIQMQGVYPINSVSLSDLNLGNLSNATIPVNCLLNFSGKVSSPQISFDLDFPSSSTDEKNMVRQLIDAQGDLTMQAVYLLTVGRFYTYNYSDYASQGSASQSTRAMQSILANTLSGQINRVLQNLLRVDNWTFGTNIATGRYGWDDLEVEAQLAARLLSNRLLLQGNIGYRDNTLGTYANDIVGNFNARYTLNPSRTISLKAYSQTTDRYFTRSTLVTSGAGVLFNRDFTNLRYFFSNFWNSNED